MRGSTGTSLGGKIEVAPWRKNRVSKRLKREQARYNRKCGPVTTRIDPSIIKEK